MLAVIALNIIVFSYVGPFEVELLPYVISVPTYDHPSREKYYIQYIESIVVDNFCATCVKYGDAAILPLSLFLENCLEQPNLQALPLKSLSPLVKLISETKGRIDLMLLYSIFDADQIDWGHFWSVASGVKEVNVFFKRVKRILAAKLTSGLAMKDVLLSMHSYHDKNPSLSEARQRFYFEILKIGIESNKDLVFETVCSLPYAKSISWVRPFLINELDPLEALRLHSTLKNQWADLLQKSAAIKPDLHNLGVRVANHLVSMRQVPAAIKSQFVEFMLSMRTLLTMHPRHDEDLWTKLRVYTFRAFSHKSGLMKVIKGIL